MSETFEAMLMGGHPNSLGRTMQVVEAVLANPERFEELFCCYGSDDAVVRLRTSNALKRIEVARHDLFPPYIDRFVAEMGPLDQPSAQWTLAQLFDRLSTDLDPRQREAATEIMKRNLVGYDDWIVLNATVETLSKWAKADASLANWLRPHLERLARDVRKSVASRASRKLRSLDLD